MCTRRLSIFFFLASQRGNSCGGATLASLDAEGDLLILFLGNGIRWAQFIILHSLYWKGYCNEISFSDGCCILKK